RDARNRDGDPRAAVHQRGREDQSAHRNPRVRGARMIVGDVRHAWRSIVRMPVVAAVVVVSLGVGIGANTAVFSWVQAMFLQPLPGVAGASRLHLVEPRNETGSYPSASWLEYQDLKPRMRALSDLIAYRMVALNVGEPGRVERAYGE